MTIYWGFRTDMDYSSLLFLDCRMTLSDGQNNKFVNEVIRLDVALVDTAKNTVAEQEIIYVKPEKTKITANCIKHFGISQAQIDTMGVPFSEAYRRLRVHHMSRDRLWSDWGSLTRMILDKQCRSLNMESLFNQQYFNLRHIFSLMVGAPNEANLNDAVKYCSTPSFENRAVAVAHIYLQTAKGLKPPFIKNATSNKLPSSQHT